MPTHDLASDRGIWRRWIQQPQKIWLRRLLFQVHLWSGIGLGLYVLMISFTGSILVYRTEIFAASTPTPAVSAGSGPQLTDAQLTDAAMHAHPGYQVISISRPENAGEAARVQIYRGEDVTTRLFDPWTGKDLGDSVSRGMRFLAWVRDLHDNLFAGRTGRNVNGMAGIAVFALAATGLVIWWPGIKTWRRSLTLHRGVGCKRFTWHLHSMIGFWSIAFVLLFAASGVYLCFPQPFEDFADRIAPITGDINPIIYWFSILHFGRINGVGFACSGPGACDQSIKAIWGLLGLAPAALFVTGAIMWWNRVLRKRM